MSHITFEDLKLILIECAGQDEQADLGVEAIDTPFADLGYDSLAVLEAAAMAGRRYGVALTDDVVQAIRTPGDFLATVNGAPAVPVAAPAKETTA
ncbi:acyl carrier protein [Dactylosporangium roseum]|uniref:Acyl carrier protein n=1 Tax=Dactylosporangium roseum TaxID=47989 RepID=A0ABY5ZB85_9ACTN|nr:acyl carrier protein [Dactylosporangium roseum]UWZ39368.1 acyl carrier protein [Dactylosporangium roseum]